ncbi:MAG: alpha-glucuronidase family glycosyl hydrolase [Kiritimatiellia bacterium]
MRIIQLLACFLLLHPVCRASWTVAVRGQAAGVSIVRPAGASASQIHAAEELQAFTEQMTGVKLPVMTDEGPLPERAILLGDTRHTAQVLGGPADMAGLGEDGFRLKTAGNHLLILGGPVRGTLTGVYELLERHGGCRWYASWLGSFPGATNGRCQTWTTPSGPPSRCARCTGSTCSMAIWPRATG